MFLLDKPLRLLPILLLLTTFWLVIATKDPILSTELLMSDFDSQLLNNTLDNQTMEASEALVANKSCTRIWEYCKAKRMDLWRNRPWFYNWHRHPENWNKLYRGIAMLYAAYLCCWIIAFLIIRRRLFIAKRS
uniref:ABC transporter permease n=1 Tax=Steinernema glaseri TaxID=37863 RepID=A0A1I8AV51_9BILA